MDTAHIYRHRYPLTVNMKREAFLPSLYIVHAPSPSSNHHLMNLQYLKYALAVARTGSMSGAAESLSVAQPNLSRAVKELETQLGIAIFDRTRTGMTVTPEGERFLSAGERLLRDLGELETMFKSETAPREVITLLCPSDPAISAAFGAFSRELPLDGRYELSLTVTDTKEAFARLDRGEGRLAILRYAKRFEGYYREWITRHGLTSEPICERSAVVVFGMASPLNACERVTREELAHLYALTVSGESATEITDSSSLAERDLSVSDRAAAYEWLVTDPRAYLYSAPIPPATATAYGLSTRPFASDDAVLCDVAVWPSHYRLSAMERQLLAGVRNALNRS